MLVRYRKRINRFANIIAERDGMVLYHAIEDGKIFNPNMVRPSATFWKDYHA